MLNTIHRQHMLLWLDLLESGMLIMSMLDGGKLIMLLSPCGFL